MRSQESKKRDRQTERVEQEKERGGEAKVGAGGGGGGAIQRVVVEGSAVCQISIRRH